MANSLIIDLQEELLKKECDIVTSLRKAHVVCRKLNLQEMDEWINYELNGYGECSEVKYPQYRIIHGELKAKNPYRGYIPVLLNNNELEKTICNRPIPNSITEIINLVATNTNLQIKLPSEQQQIINKLCCDGMNFEIAVVLSNSAVADIIEKVKNTLLEWTLRLESDGIIGNDMVFTEKEKKAANSIQQYFIYGTANVINENNGVLNQINGSNNKIIFSQETFLELISDIKNELSKEKINKNDKQDALEIIECIDENIASKKPSSFIKACFEGLKDFLIGVGASLTAALIQSKLGI